MFLLICAIFILAFVLALFEEEEQRPRLFHIIYGVFGLLLALCAGFKEVGFDKDSEQYQFIYERCDDITMLLQVEYSYLLVCQIVSATIDDLHAVFLFYSGVGIALKCLAFRRYSDLLFLPLLVYMGHYMILHDFTQIRIAVASGIILLSIRHLAEGNRKRVILYLCVAGFFHYSTLAFIPALFLNNNAISKKQLFLWAMLVPLGYLICFSPISLAELDIPYLGDKLNNYQEMNEKGVEGGRANIFGVLFILRVLIYYYIMLFYDTILCHNKYLPLMLKLFGTSLFAFLFFSFLPVLAFRISEVYGIVEIILFANLYHTVRPKWLGATIVFLIGLGFLLVNVFNNEMLQYK